jgi:hypothetical protein
MYSKCTISAGAIENNEKSIENPPGPLELKKNKHYQKDDVLVSRAMQ